MLSQQFITLEIPNGFQNVIKHEINKKDETMIIKKGKKNRYSIFKDSKISYELSETYMHWNLWCFLANMILVKV